MGHEPFAVLLGDDLIDPRDPLLKRMVEVQEQHGGSVIALMEVAPEQIHLYGCAAVEATEDSDVVQVTGREARRGGRPVELRHHRPLRPRPHIFDVLRKTEPGRGGEIQLTDALQQLAEDERSAAPCTASSSRAAAMTPATAATTCVPLSDSRANVRTWARTSGPGFAVTSAEEM